MKSQKIILSLVFLIIFSPAVWCELAYTAQPENDPNSVDPQLEINKSALLSGPTEEVRIMTARVMIFTTDPAVRKALINILTDTDNSGAVAAVCKILIESRQKNEAIPSKKDFIQPLLKLLRWQDNTVVTLAAEALMIFDYDTVGPSIEALAEDTTEDIRYRLNGVNALKIRPDKRAAITLITLVDDPSPQMTEAVIDTLHSIRIPFGDSRADRERIIEELKQKTKDEFLRGWVFSQDERLRQERAQTELWKRQYFDVLDKFYGQLPAQDRGPFLVEHLKSQQSERKLWALNKVYELRFLSWRRFEKDPFLSE